MNRASKMAAARRSLGNWDFLKLGSHYPVAALGERRLGIDGRRSIGDEDYGKTAAFIRTLCLAASAAGR